MNSPKQNACRFCWEVMSPIELINMEEHPGFTKSCMEKIKFLKMDFIDLTLKEFQNFICQACDDALSDAYIFFAKIKEAQAFINCSLKPETKVSKLTIKLEEIDDDADINNESIEASTSGDISTHLECTEESDTNTNIKNENALLEGQERPVELENDGENSLSEEENDSINSMDEETRKFLQHYNFPNTNRSLSVEENININSMDEETRKFLQHYNFPKTNREENTETSISEVGSNQIACPGLEKGAPICKKPNCFCPWNYKERNSQTLDINISWLNQTWLCSHCKIKCNSLDDLREHSKLLHGKCCGFVCAFCPEPFITFTAFVEHVRTHIPSLRFYCQFCNTQFPNTEDCTTHSLTHWFENKVCVRCGEQLPDTESFRQHKETYKKSIYPLNYKRRKAKRVPTDLTFTWDKYEAVCQWCYMKFPDLESLRHHSEDIHLRCFASKCIDCHFISRDFKTFVAHILQHRMWLKVPCPHCGEPFRNNDIPTRHLRTHETNEHTFCNKCGRLYDQSRLEQHADKYMVHGHKISLKCNLCSKEYSGKAQLKEHKRLKHSETIQKHICDVCGRSFISPSSFKSHIQTHQPKNEICEYCHLAFPTSYALKVHVKTHLNLKAEFYCDHCGKEYKRKKSLRFHLKFCNTGVKEVFKCRYCDKTFRCAQYRRCHEYMHTGQKSYNCQKCPLSFSNWGNCNKHMMRRHGVTLAKTKKTDEGRLRVNEVGEVLEVKNDVKERLYDIASKPRVKKKGKSKVSESNSVAS